MDTVAVSTVSHYCKDIVDFENRMKAVVGESFAPKDACVLLGMSYVHYNAVKNMRKNYTDTIKTCISLFMMSDDEVIKLICREKGVF